MLNCVSNLVVDASLELGQCKFIHGSEQWYTCIKESMESLIKINASSFQLSSIV